MVGGVHKPTQSLAAAGHDSKDSRTEGSNGTGLGIYVQGGGEVGVTIWKQELAGDRGYAQGPNNVLTSGGIQDDRDDGKTWGRRRVGVSIGRVGDGLRGDPPHWIIHQETVENLREEGGRPDRICTIHGGGEDAGDYPNGALVGSIQSKSDGVINEEKV